jgi:hypothetical protein
LLCAAANLLQERGEGLKRPLGACGFQKLLKYAKDGVCGLFVFHVGAPMDWLTYFVIVICAILFVGSVAGLVREVRNPKPPVIGIPMDLRRKKG